jgi:hypothetical protein
MCHYDYYQYDLCGHKAIEILQYCNEVLWKAGMTFQLRPCPEENFINFCEKILNIPSKDIGKCYWKGMSGYCKMCESSFQVCLAMSVLGLCSQEKWSGSRSRDERIYAGLTSDS